MSIPKEVQDKLVRVMRKMYEMEGEKITPEVRMMACNTTYAIVTYNTDVDDIKKFSAVLTDDDIEISNWINEEMARDLNKYNKFFQFIFETFDVDSIKFSDGHYYYPFTRGNLDREATLYNILHIKEYDYLQTMIDKINEMGIEEFYE